MEIVDSLSNSPESKIFFKCLVANDMNEESSPVQEPITRKKTQPSTAWPNGTTHFVRVGSWLGCGMGWPFVEVFHGVGRPRQHLPALTGGASEF